MSRPVRRSRSRRARPGDEPRLGSAGIYVQRASRLVSHAAVVERALGDPQDVVAVVEIRAVIDPVNDLVEEEVGPVGVDVPAVAGSADLKVAGPGAVRAI